jgi:8-oxo-dGTP diphosphatase
MKKVVYCPQCGARVQTYRNPFPTVDLIIQIENGGLEGIVLISRRNPPEGWALPGGFVDYGESVEQAALREAREETGLDVTDLRQFHVYSAPERDPRQHNISVVFLARAVGRPEPGDDALNCGIFAPRDVPSPLAFDHGKIIEDYLAYLDTSCRP